MNTTYYPRQSADPTLTLTRTSFDTMGRANLSQVLDRSGAVVQTSTTTFDVLSRPVSVTLTGETSATTASTYDDLGRLTSFVTDGPAGVTSAATTFDVAGLPLSTTYGALGSATTVTNTYAKTNQWLTSTMDASTIWSFTTGVDGSVRSINSALQAVSRDTDAYHRLVSVRIAKPAGAAKSQLSVETLGYDAWDRIASVALASPVAGFPTTTDSYAYTTRPGP